MRILLSAYSCAPGRGSELGQGWNWAHQLSAMGHDVVVITRAANKDLIKGAADQSGFECVFFDIAEPLRRIHNASMLGARFHYYLWQYWAARHAKKLHAIRNFDLVHHITWTAFRYPTFMGHIGIPFVFGPVGGGERTPKTLLKGLGLQGIISDLIRTVSTASTRADPMILITYHRASIIFATTTETLGCIPKRFHAKSKVRPAIGIAPPDDEEIHKRATSSPTFRLLYAGRLLPWKGLHLALKSLARLRDRDITLTVIGKGPDLPRLQRLASEHKITTSVSFVPWVDHQELIKMYKEYDLFVFPSLHDSGGYAILEAFSCGLPVLSLDIGGPGVLVDENCGKAINTRGGASEDDVVRQMSEFIARLKKNPQLAERLSHGARERAESFSWDISVRGVYSEIETLLRKDRNTPPIPNFHQAAEL